MGNMQKWTNFHLFTYYSFISPNFAKAGSRSFVPTIIYTNTFCTSNTTYVHKQSPQMGYSTGDECTSAWHTCCSGTGSSCQTFLDNHCSVPQVTCCLPVTDLRMGKIGHGLEQWRAQKIFMRGVSISGMWWSFVFGVRSL